MNRTMKFVLLGSMVLFMVFCKISHLRAEVLPIASLLSAVAMVIALGVLIHRNEASPIHKAMAATIVLACASIWVWPGGAGRWVVASPLALLYAMFFVMAITPLITGHDVFTMYFARKTTPEAVWKTDLFRTINRHLTSFWAALFFLGFLSALIPHVVG
ncbi:MAG: hypothetical protein JRL30_23665, partial [Deltaproteobacteria bacterium]|nr:hypothetical protein [Deltaproteobacteria bacterium]